MNLSNRIIYIYDCNTKSFFLSLPVEILWVAAPISLLFAVFGKFKAG